MCFLRSVILNQTARRYKQENNVKAIKIQIEIPLCSNENGDYNRGRKKLELIFQYNARYFMKNFLRYVGAISVCGQKIDITWFFVNLIWCILFGLTAKQAQTRR